MSDKLIQDINFAELLYAVPNDQGGVAYSIFTALKKQAGKEIENLRQQLKEARNDVISEFGEDEVPSFTQGYPQMELQELVTANRLNELIKITAGLYQQLKEERECNEKMLEALKMYGIHLGYCNYYKPYPFSEERKAEWKHCTCGLEDMIARQAIREQDKE